MVVACVEHGFGVGVAVPPLVVEPPVPPPVTAQAPNATRQASQARPATRSMAPPRCDTPLNDIRANMASRLDPSSGAEPEKRRASDM